MFTLNIVFVFIFHPLAIIIVLIAQSVLVSIILFRISHFPWFSYTLILVFLGGILILFTYIANIASNEKFTPNLKLLGLLTLLTRITLILGFPGLKIPQDYKPLDQEQIIGLLILKPFDSVILPLIVLIAGLILLALLGVVKIRKINSGPLRID